jgi:hypothetical protein
MNFQSINIAFLAGDTAAILLVLGSLGPWNPIVVTNCYGKAVNNRY